MVITEGPWLMLKFTPLEFETNGGLGQVVGVVGVKIYSVGV